MATPDGQRSLSEIAREIRANWPNMYFGARPYLQAMETLSSMEDKIFDYSARRIVIQFLDNAHIWMGETADRIKKELNDMIEDYEQKCNMFRIIEDRGCGIKYDVAFVEESEINDALDYFRECQKEFDLKNGNNEPWTYEAVQYLSDNTAQ